MHGFFCSMLVEAAHGDITCCLSAGGGISELFRAVICGKYFQISCNT